MSTDLSEFLDVFFEECFEGLDVMEAGLIALDSGNADCEEINTIFRAAHSIKGGAATFDMKEVAEFTHVMETLLDEMRDGRRQVEKPAVDLLLESVDGLRAMCTAIRAEESIDGDRVAVLKTRLEQMLQEDNDEPKKPQASPAQAAAAPMPSPMSTQPEAVLSTWHISFAPHPQLFQSGNDPLYVLRALASLGAMEVVTDATGLPQLKLIDPQTCYLKWSCRLQTAACEAQIREVFDWVEDECELHIECEQPAVAQGVAGDVGAAAIEPSSTSNPGAATPTPVQSNTLPAAQNTPRVPSSSTPTHRQSSAGEGGSIRVGIEKVDDLINLVGELVITQSMLNRFCEGVTDQQLEELRDGLAALQRNTRELQEMAMQIRMLPISTSFNRFPRLVRDLSAKLGKKVELKISGGGTELDKTVLEKIGDPLVHLVRNSMDHGIESPQRRRDAGKSDTGTVTLNAYHQGGNIVIEVIDDGAGLNTERILAKAHERGLVSVDSELTDDQINNLIFQPGFSTADEVSDVSGRGVGMDVVRRNIQDLGGNVVVESCAGQGSIFTIRLPLTLAILDGQLVRVGNEIYIISLLSIVESLQVSSDKVNVIAGKGEVFKLREEFIPVIRLYQSFNVDADSTRLEDGLLVVVEAHGGRVGLFVDELLGQQQVVIKSLETNFRQIDALSGATILGDGMVALILDVPGLVKRELNGPSKGSTSQVKAA